MQPYYYLNGKIIPQNRALISVQDLGVLRGYGVFDFLRTYFGEPFLLKEHLARFGRSARTIGLKLPKSDREIAGIIKRLLKRNRYAESGIRMILTAGLSPDSVNYDPNRPTFYIMVDEFHAVPPIFQQRGVKLITYEYQRPNPGAKTTDYLVPLSLEQWRKKQKAFQILYTYQGSVLEASKSNFFMVKGQRLITPGKNVLEGTTRALVLKLAKKKLAKKLLRVELRDLKVKELSGADEAFVTGSSYGIMPVVGINQRRVGQGRVGKITRRLIDEYRKYAEGYVF